MRRLLMVAFATGWLFLPVILQAAEPILRLKGVDAGPLKFGPYLNDPPFTIDAPNPSGGKPIRKPTRFVYTRRRNSEGGIDVSQDGSPLYEGVNPGVNPPVKVSLSFKTMIDKRHLQESAQPVEPSKDHPDGLQIFASAQALQNLLEFYRSKPEIFTRFFSGMSRQKAELFRGLLFNQKVVLTQDDLNALGRTASKKTPAPLKIPLKISLAGQKKAGYVLKFLAQFADLTYIIEVKKIEFDFTSKILEFDPVQQTLHLVLVANVARMEGPMSERGRLKEVFPAYEFWNDESVLTSGEVGPLSLHVYLRFERRSNGMWQIALKEPGLKLQMHEANPKVKMRLVRKRFVNAKEDPSHFVQDEIVFDDPPSLGDVQRLKIENTLKDALTDATASSFFANDLGFIASLSPLGFRDTTLEASLSRVDILDSGLLIGFDARENIYRRAACSSAALEKKDSVTIEGAASKDFERIPFLVNRPTSSFYSENSRWRMTNDLDKQIGWTGAAADSKADLSFFVSKDTLSAMSRAAYAGGAYCLSTIPRSWQKPSVDIQKADEDFGDLPWVEMKSLGLPQVHIEAKGPSLDDAKMSLRYQAEIQVYDRPENYRGEAYRPTLASTVEALASMRFQNPRAQISEIQIEGFKLGDLANENGRLRSNDEEGIRSIFNASLKNIFLHFFGLGPTPADPDEPKLASAPSSPFSFPIEGWTLPFSEIENWVGSSAATTQPSDTPFQVRQLSWSPDGFFGSIDPKKFAWIETISSHGADSNAIPIEPSMDSQPISWSDLRTVFAADLKASTDQPFYTVRFTNTSDDPSVMYRFKKRGPQELNWSNEWSSFEKKNSVDFACEKPGRYEILVMSRRWDASVHAFQLENEPQKFEFQYLPLPKNPAPPDEPATQPSSHAEDSSDVSPPESADLPTSRSSKTESNGPRESSKGAFGCMLAVEATLSSVFFLLLVFAAWICFVIQIRRTKAPHRGILVPGSKRKN